MKCLFYLVILMPLFLSAQNAHDILQQIQLHLPQQPIIFNGTIQRRTEKGFKRFSEPIQTTLRLGDIPAKAHSRIGEVTLDVKWEDNKPVYVFSDASLKSHHEIGDSGMNGKQFWIALL